MTCKVMLGSEIPIALVSVSFHPLVGIDEHCAEVGVALRRRPSRSKPDKSGCGSEPVVSTGLPLAPLTCLFRLVIRSVPETNGCPA